MIKCTVKFNSCKNLKIIREKLWVITLLHIHVTANSTQEFLMRDLLRTSLSLEMCSLAITMQIFRYSLALLQNYMYIASRSLLELWKDSQEAPTVLLSSKFCTSMTGIHIHVCWLEFKNSNCDLEPNPKPSINDQFHFVQVDHLVTRSHI